MRSPTGKKAKSSTVSNPSAEKQLAGFIAKFAPEHQKVIRAARQWLRKRMRTAHELVYDNYNFFVIGYSPTERPTDYIVSIAAAANGVGLSFNHGATLQDPDGLLLGSGKQNRFVRLPSASTLQDPGVARLITAAVEQSAEPLPKSGKGRLIIRSISAKQRPRRGTAKK